MSNKTAVSVVVPVYNQELFIGRCLRSLLDQTLDKESYEIVVVNDCSKDNTLPILEKFKNKLIVPFRFERTGSQIIYIFCL